MDIEPAFRVLVDENPVFFAVVFIKNDEAPNGLCGCSFCIHGATNRASKTSPLAKVASRIKVCHAGGVIVSGGALGIADDKEAVLLVQICGEEKGKEAAKNIKVKWFLFFADPSVAHCLKDERDAVHLAVSANAFAVGPAEAVCTDNVREHAEILLGAGAQRGELAVAQVHIGVQLKRLANENDREDAVDVIDTGHCLRVVVEQTSGAAADAIHE